MQFLIDTKIADAKIKKNFSVNSRIVLKFNRYADKRSEIQR
jgi:hypothetical protein